MTGYWFCFLCFLLCKFYLVWLAIYNFVGLSTVCYRSKKVDQRAKKASVSVRHAVANIERIDTLRTYFPKPKAIPSFYVPQISLLSVPRLL